MLAIDTDMEDTYYISDTPAGFQCDAFDFVFEDIDSMGVALFNVNLFCCPMDI